MALESAYDTFQTDFMETNLRRKKVHLSFLCSTYLGSCEELKKNSLFIDF